jgi:hypothetical protein
MVEITYTNSKKEIFINNETVYLFDYTGPLSVEESAFSFIKGLEKQSVNKKYIEDFYVYDGIPLYYFVRPSFYGKLKNIIFYVELLEKIVTDNHKHYTVKTDDRTLYLVANKIFNIHAELIIKNETHDKDKKLSLHNCLFKRYARGVVSFLKFYIRAEKNNMLAITHSADINFINNKYCNGYFDTQLGPIISKLRSTFNVLEMQLLNNKSQLEKSVIYKNKYVPFELFVLYKKILTKKIFDKSKVKNFIEYFSNIEFNYREYNLKYVVSEEVIVNFENECVNYLSEILSAERFIRKYKFVKCLIAGEGDRGRCFVVASHRAGIPCYAVQHGIINETSPNYIIYNSSKINLVPSVSFLWGKKYLNILLENTNIYNENNTRIVGQVRTDLLNQYQNKFNKNRSSIRILYATQYLKDLLEPATEMLFKSLNQIRINYELVIKLHPADNYLEIYKDLISLYNIKNVRIVKDEDLYNLISWCDIVVSVHSTVVLEGALMGKPSVCIILPKYNDEGNFVKDGVSLGAKDEHQLANYLLNHNLDYLDRLKAYIGDNFYAVDGNVSDRIVKEISN